MPPQVPGPNQSSPEPQENSETVASRAFSTTSNGTQSLEMFQGFQGLSQELWCLLDNQGQFLALNSAWQELLGWSSKELLNQPWITQVHPNDLTQTLSSYSPQDRSDTDDLGLEEGLAPAVHVENRYRTQQGHYDTIHWSMRVSSNNQCCVVGRRIQASSESKTDASPQAPLHELADILSSQANQLATRYRTATSVSHLPDFPLSYASLFESLLDSLYPAMPYDISGVLLLQESVATSTSNRQPEDALHLFLTQLAPQTVELQQSLEAELTKTLSFLTGRDCRGLPLHLHSSNLFPSELSRSEVSTLQTFQSQIIVPLVTKAGADSQIIGLIFVAAQQVEQFTEEHVRLLYNAAGHLGVSLQRLQLLWFKAEKQYLNQILNKLPTGVLLLDSDRKTFFSNERAKTHLSHIGITQIDNKVLRIGSRTIESLLRCRLTDSSCREITAVRSADRVYEVLVQPLILEENRGVALEELAGDLIVIIWDISDRKQAEFEVKQALEKEQEINLLKSNIIRTVSHEYRSPLTSILGSTQTLKTYPTQLEEEKCTRLLSIVEDSARHLNQLVDEMLGMEEIESGRLEFNPVTLNLILFCQRIVEESRLLGNHRHRISLSHRGNCETVFLDPNLLRQILTNLLSNAVKYSPDGGQVELQLQCNPQQVNFWVKDEGIGIPADEQAQLFQSFYRASNVGFIQGSGLGLNITKKFVDLHQGNITFESMIGSGSTFLVQLPQLAREE